MNTPPDPGSRAAIVVDQSELFRLGVENVLTDMDFLVVGSTSRLSDGIRIARSSASEILIVGKTPDLKHQNALRVIKSLRHPPYVMFLIDQAGQPDVARLISRGADGLVLRAISRYDLTDAIRGVVRGERVIAPALAAGAIGRVGPTMDISVEEAVKKSGLSARELDVLGELAAGATYDEIAAVLVVTKATVKTHLIHIYDKLEVKNRNEAVTSRARARHPRMTLIRELNVRPEFLDAIGKWAVDAARFGFDRVGLWDTSVDDARNWARGIRSAAAALEQSGLHEGPLSLGPNVTNFVEQTPGDIIKKLMSVSRAHPHARFWVGIGRGDSALRARGLKPASIEHTLRAALGLQYQLNSRQAQLGEVPVVVAAHGPRMLQAFGESINKYGGGPARLILGYGFDEPALEFVRSALGPAHQTTEIVINPAIVDTVPVDSDELSYKICQHARHVVFGAEHVPEYFPEQHLVPALRMAANAYPKSMHGVIRVDSPEFRAMHEAVQRAGDEFRELMLRRFFILGTPQAVAQRIFDLTFLQGISGVSISATNRPGRVERCGKILDAVEWMHASTRNRMHEAHLSDTPLPDTQPRFVPAELRSPASDSLSSLL